MDSRKKKKINYELLNKYLYFVAISASKTVKFSYHDLYITDERLKE